MALYHKYRPQQFSDLIGQEHVKKILEEALKERKTAHGYLFAGPRGLGKTTTARILAKALNCLSAQAGQKGALCNKCNACIEITEGRSLDVIEIDAASNRGIDEIRELREKIKFAPTASQYKVFIIDEVHMLTKEAFNALLKTLEEPPKHAVFVLATTEPHKVPATIISRVQRFDFHRPTLQKLSDWLREIAKQEKRSLESEASLELARLADGSFRDGLTLLEQVIGTKRQITRETVLEVLGLPESARIDQILDAFIDCAIPKGLAAIASLYEQGIDFGYLYKELIMRTRDKMIKNGDSSFAGLLQALINAQEQAKIAPLPQIPIEIALMERCSVPQIQNSKFKIQNDNVKVKSDQKNESITDMQWQKIIQAVKASNHSLAGILKQGKLVSLDNDTLTIAVKFAFHKDRIQEPKNHANLGATIGAILGKKVAVVCVVDDTLTPVIVEQDNLYNEALEVFGE